MYKSYTLEEKIELANQGNPEFQHRLARHHLVRTKDYGEAKKWLELAADQGYAPALIDLGHSYFIGKYTEKDAEKGERYFRLAIAQGDSKAMLQLGYIYWHGEYVPKNEEEALKLWRASADLGNGGALSALGKCFLYGNVVEKNYDEAFKCFTAANDTLMLGECYLNGLGVERNVEKTIELWKEGAELPSYVYIEKLAHLYGDGVDMVPDHEKALNLWFEMVHEDDEDGKIKGSVEAMYQIACYYYEGKGVKKSVTKALKWFKHAIDMLYLDDGIARYEKYDRELHDMVYPSYKVDSNCYISQEPDFIIHARKILIKHGQKSIINKTKKAAENGDSKAAEILREFKIGFNLPKLTLPVTLEVKEEPIATEKPKRESPINIAVGDTVLHKTFGEGCVCESEDGYVLVEFASVGQKKFLNPEAFNKGFLKIQELT